MEQQILIIGHTFPEPTTTAAGSRMMQLLTLFLAEKYRIHFASTAATSDHSAPLDELGIVTHAIELNNASFDELLNELQPTIVLFDRFITEEQFGWRVASMCPDALRILDTEDVHFLRKAREEAYKKGIPVAEAMLNTDTAKRELASILRCDLSLLISKVEYDLLTNTFMIPEGLLWYLPFLVASEISTEDQHELDTFDTRAHFMAVGNLKHAPNVAAVQLLNKHIWPKVRQHLPKAELHIYGAYAPQHIQEMHSPASGFFIMGWASNISEVMQHHRVQLAPLPFGAGLKGKLLDAMQNGLPTVTTQMGAEGYYSTTEDLAFISDDLDAFAAQAVTLYTQKEAWKTVQTHGFQTVNEHFLQTTHAASFIARTKALLQNLKQHRQQHFLGQVLQHQSLQATKYLSKWIEEKNKK